MMDAYMTRDVRLILHCKDDWGAITEQEIKVKAHVDEKNRLINDFAGNQVTSMSKVTISTKHQLKPDDRIKIDGTEHKIINILKPTAFNMQAYQEVFLG